MAVAIGNKVAEEGEEKMLQQDNERKRKTAGYTLVELIVVIAVLGILALITIPRFTGQISVAQDEVDEANAKLLTNIAHVVNTQNGAFPSWSATFNVLTVAQATIDGVEYLSQDVEIQNNSNIFQYDNTTGTITVSSSGGGTEDPIPSEDPTEPSEPESPSPKVEVTGGGNNRTVKVTEIPLDATHLVLVAANGNESILTLGENQVEHTYTTVGSNIKRLQIKNADVVIIEFNL